ncbi:oligosaccharide flippase family protein, partial [Glaciimonas sp. CA11.2]
YGRTCNIETLAYVISGFLLFKAGYGAVSLIYGAAIASFISLLFGWRKIVVNELSKSTNGDQISLVTVVRFCLKTHVVDIPRMFLMQAPQLYIARFIGLGEAGLYNVSTAIANVCLTFIKPVAAILLSEKKRDENVARQSLHAVVILCIPLFLSYAFVKLFGNDLFTAIFGSKFGMGMKYLDLALFIGFFSTLSQIYFSAAMAISRPEIGAISAVSALLVGIGIHLLSQNTSHFGGNSLLVGLISIDFILLAVIYHAKKRV